VRQRDYEQPPCGAYAALEDLIALRFPARHLDITRRRRALSRLAGNNRANFRGRGIDFDEVRSYQAGDDIRAIDWRVTARTGSAHTKLFHEERERPVLVVVDQRPGMFFGSRHCFKSVLAAYLTALVAWSALGAGERVGGLVFGSGEHRDIRPRRSRHAVLTLLSTVVAFNGALTAPVAEPAAAADMLGNMRRIARPGSSIFIISDCRGFLDDAAREHLFQLSRHAELTVLHCSDPLERALPPPGDYAVTDGRDRRTLSTASATLRQRFAARTAAAEEALTTMLARLGIPCIAASTGDAPVALLRQVYGGVAR
jgi:uncharacterized protein (DUF58 family)